MILTKLNGDFKHKHDDDDNGWYLGEPRASWALALTMGRLQADTFDISFTLSFALYFAQNTLHKILFSILF